MCKSQTSFGAWTFSEVVRIGDIEAHAGEMKNEYLQVGETATATVRVPLAIINGLKLGPKLCISGGVHGCESVGVEAVIRVLRQPNPANLSGTLSVVPVVCAREAQSKFYIRKSAP